MPAAHAASSTRLHARRAPGTAKILAVAEVDVAGPAQCRHAEAETGDHHGCRAEGSSRITDVAAFVTGHSARCSARVRRTSSGGRAGPDNRTAARRSPRFSPRAHLAKAP